MGVLWFNGHIYTMEEDGKKVEAVVTEDGKILGTGTVADMTATFGKYISEKRDLEGHTMLPGLVDGHMHLLGHGESLYRLNLTEIKSKDELLNAVRKKAEELHEDEWIIGEGWNENVWDNPTLPSKEELNEAALGRPAVLKRVCRHALLANKKAMELAGISRDTPDPSGGVIERTKTGEPTGLLKDRAQDMLHPVMPSYSLPYLKQLARKAVQSCYSYGLTGSHTEDLSYYGGFENTYEAIRHVVEEEFPYRAHLLIHHEVVDKWKAAGFQPMEEHSFLSFGAMKIFTDGSLGGRTALLSQPYGDDPTTHGVAIQSKEHLIELVKKARSYGMPVGIHAIGDLAFEWALDAIEAYPHKGPGRDRIIHAQILRKELVDRAKKIEVVLDIQPRFLISDFPWALDRLGDFRPEYLYAWKSLIKEGLICGGGSDAPIEPINPFLGLHAAVTRKNINDGTVYHPWERLSMYEAVSLFTKGNAYAAHKEHKQGMIKQDYVADFTIIDKNIFESDPDVLLETKAIMTVVGGKIVYEA